MPLLRRNAGAARMRWLAVLMLLSTAGAAGAATPSAVDTPAAGASPLRFDIREGDIDNRFYRQGEIAAHALLSDGARPRLLVAFPAGNSGAGLWFEPTAAPVHWRLRGELQGVQRRDGRGRPLRGISLEATVDAPTLTVRTAALGSIRVLRDVQAKGTQPAGSEVQPGIEPQRLRWSRDRLDGAAGYALEVEVLDGRAEGGAGRPVVLHAPAHAPLRLRIVALTGETPLTPLTPAQLFSAEAGTDPRSRQALEFLAYREKLLAGSWRFDTYFGRDTLLSLRLLLPALAPEAVEAGLGSVLERLDRDGEVAHEEDIGEFAVLRHRAAGRRGDATPLYDYKMIDDDFMLAPVAAAWLLDSADGRAHAAEFLARTTTSGERYGDALARNLAWVVDRTAAFAAEPRLDNLVGLLPGHPTGEWRDSEQGLGGGRYPYNVNAVLVPAALEAAARLAALPALRPYLEAGQARKLATAKAMAARWREHAPPLFALERTPDEARAAVTAYARRIGVDPSAALSALGQAPLRFDALALKADGQPVPVLNSDGGFALLFLDPPAAEVERLLASMLRPFPAGLMTGIGLLVANPAYAPALQPAFGADAYHGTVVWSWQQALLAAGLERQQRREDLPAATRARIAEARRQLWKAIEATPEVRTSELWSWAYEDGHYRVVPFGQRHGDADESNAAQLWSTVFLALPGVRGASE
ncbi:hypothetical protein [[Pseudomonas] boreopolis]|uniref:hypothetical protein n=1 Tax=Xanthomonas boreopolis TaxID=86183 RepID=UPI003DA047F6